MTSPRDVPPEPSAEKMAQQALDDLCDECGHEGWSGDCAGLHRCCRKCVTAILSRLVRDAQIAQAEANAKAVCMICAGERLDLQAVPQIRPHFKYHNWWHKATGDDCDWAVGCYASAVWDALSKLKESL